MARKAAVSEPESISGGVAVANTPNPINSSLTVPLPTRGDGGAAARKAMASKVINMKEDVRTVIANDFVENSFPTGSIVIDHVLGIHEIPLHGRMIHVHGEEHTGKSTLLYTLAGAYQRVWGKPVVVWDLEGQLEPKYLWNCGMNSDPALTYLRMPVDIHDVLKFTLEYLEPEAGSIPCQYFIFDSVAWMLPLTTMKAVRAGKAMDLTIGDHAKLVKRFLGVLVPRARVADAAIHFVNQQTCLIPQNTKESMAMKYPSITNWNHTITGGKAIRYAASLMFVTSKGKAFEGAGDDEEWLFPTGEGKAGAGRSWDVNKTRIRVVKNKINDGGYREYDIYIRPGGGIDDWISVRELARHYELISKASGGWVVGKPECPLATFKNKASAIEALVVRQDPALLLPLRALTVDAIINDDPRKFAYERTIADKVVAGEMDLEAAGSAVTTEDFLGTANDDGEAF